MNAAIAELIQARGISEVVHFTTNRGFTGCLEASAVLARNFIKSDDRLEHILTLNAPYRTEENPGFDKTEAWIDYVSLSISEISTHFFRYSSQKWHMDAEYFWLIMAFDPLILTQDGVYFSTTNNIYPSTQRAQGSQGLESLFAPMIQRKPGWQVSRLARTSELPTCEQAEVLYPNPLPLDFLRAVYVKTGEESDRIHALLAIFDRADVEVIVDKNKFAGAPN